MALGIVSGGIPLGHNCDRFTFSIGAAGSVTLPGLTPSRRSVFAGFSAFSTAIERHGDLGTVLGPADEGRELDSGTDGIVYCILGDALRVCCRGWAKFPLGSIALRSVTGRSDEGVCIDSVRAFGPAGRAGTVMSLPDEEDVKSNICSSPARTY